MQDISVQNSASIGTFKRHGLRSALFFGEDILITNHVEYIEPFRDPCRLDAITVLVCTGGSVECSINLHHYQLEKDTVLVAFAGDIVQVHHAEKMGAYAIVISDSYLNNLQIDFRQRTSFLIDIRRNAISNVPHEEIVLLKPYYDLLSANIRNTRAESREILKGLVRAFSYTIISLMRTEQGDEDYLAAPRSQQLFEKFMSLLHAHHTHERSVTYYAGAMCLTPNYMSGEVKAYSGRSALEWINEYVVTEAKLLLRNTDNCIQDIARLLNFPSQSAFGKYFRGQTGISPLVYRKEAGST